MIVASNLDVEPTLDSHKVDCHVTLSEFLSSSQMSLSKPITILGLLPKRPDIDGSPEQVFKYDTFHRSFVDGITNGAIAALGTVNIGSSCLQYIFDPVIYKNLDGKVIAIIGNASNSIGEFSLVRVETYSLRYFAVINERAKLHQSLTIGEDLSAELLAPTTVWDGKTGIAAAALPNFFPLYYGQEPVYGDLRSEEVQAKMAELGEGYKVWASSAAHAMANTDDTLTVVDSILSTKPDANASIVKYLHPTWVPNKSPQFASSNGPCGTLVNVPSDQYPQEAAKLKAKHIQVQPTQPAQQQQSTFTIAVQGEAEKEAEAKAGIVKLMLFFIGAVIDFEAGALTEVTQAVPAPGMEIVLATSRAARPQAYADLLKKVCELAANQDSMSIRSTQMTMRIIQKAVASNMLAGNFATESALSLYSEANSIDASIFMPQVNLAQVETIRQGELVLRNEARMDLADCQRSKPKTAMARIGALPSIEGFSSTCVNIDTLVSGTVTHGSPMPVIRQIMLGFITTINSPNWRVWWEICGGEMPHLHWLCYGYLESIWMGMAKFATDFTNCNVIVENRPLTELDYTGIKDALRVYKAFRNKILDAQATSTPIKDSPRHLQLANTIPAENTVSAPRESQAGRRDRTSDHSTSGSNGSSGSNGGSNEDNNKRSKKPKRGSKPDTPAPSSNKVDLGMFYLHNSNMPVADIFPANLNPKFCANFCCKGKECTCPSGQCAFEHARNGAAIKALSNDAIAAIAQHFIDKNVGWFSRPHFEGIALAPAHAALLGDKTGPRAQGSNGSAPSNRT